MGSSHHATEGATAPCSTGITGQMPERSADPKGRYPYLVPALGPIEGVVSVPRYSAAIVGTFVGCDGGTGGTISSRSSGRRRLAFDMEIPPVNG